MSSAEAELSSLIKGACEGVGVKNLLEEMDLKTSLTTFIDSSAARGVSQRIGVGKIKHMSVKTMWIQEKGSGENLGGGEDPPEGKSKWLLHTSYYDEGV